MCNLCIISVQASCSAHGFLQTLTNPFPTFLSVLVNYSKRMEDQKLQIKCRICFWVEEGDPNSWTALRGNLCPCAVGPQNSYLASRQRLLLRELFMHMGINTGTGLSKPKSHKSLPKTLQGSQRGRNLWWKIWVNFPIFSQDFHRVNFSHFPLISSRIHPCLLNPTK